MSPVRGKTQKGPLAPLPRGGHTVWKPAFVNRTGRPRIAFSADGLWLPQFECPTLCSPRPPLSALWAPSK